jgi:hypothetical protein
MRSVFASDGTPMNNLVNTENDTVSQRYLF